MEFHRQPFQPVANQCRSWANVCLLSGATPLQSRNAELCLKANFHWNRHGSGTAANRSPKIIETIKVNVGYSTGYGTGTERNRPQTGTSFTILASSISESCRFAAVSQNTTTANQFAFVYAHIDPYAIHRVFIYYTVYLWYGINS